MPVFSVAGKREGLEGKSGLFYEAVRVLKEMRQATNGEFPKFAVMENVVGIFSSKTHGRSDFLEVLNELVKIKQDGLAPDETLSVPMPESGKWSTSGLIVGDAGSSRGGFSLGWRTFDAQFWGVPQRRRRCYIVVDFTGGRAERILFDETRLRGNPPQGFFTREETAGDITDRAGNAGCIGFEPGAASRLGGHVWADHVGALRADAGDNQTAVVYDARGNGDGETVNTITGDHENRVTDYTALAVEPGTFAVQGSMIGRADNNGPQGSGIGEDVSFTLNTADRHSVAYAMTTGCYTQVCEEQSPTLQARDYKDAPVVARPQYVVRRLMPQECALLQGFPSDWCAGLETPEPSEDDIAFWSEVWETYRRVVSKASKPKSRNQIIKWLKNPHTDSAEYKMWGNGVSLPIVYFVMMGIAEAAEQSS